jgi:acyl phosphate:glycerol-3-phosphate acyltransferase
MPPLAYLLLGYVLGSIPFGLLLTRAAGLGDIRQIGSGNIGATNVLRTGHKGLALATLLLDAGKGALAVALAWWLLGAPFAPWAGLAAVVSHMHPVWLGFKGGKGVATALGTFWALAWPVGLAACLAWLAGAAIFRISSVGALSAMAAAAIAGFVLLPQPVAFGLLAVCLYVVWRHKTNIQRLLAGTEPRIGQKSKGGGK